MPEEMNYHEWCIGTARAIAAVLQDLEVKMRKQLADETCPYELPDGVDPREVVAGAILMVVCGMVVDPDGDKGVVMRAAERLRSQDLPAAEEVREAVDSVMDTLGLKRTRHLWN